MASPDTASAEWIAEAPTTVTPGGTRILPLTDFGTVRFTGATATSSTGHTGRIADSAWSSSRILLEAGSSGPGNFGPYAAESAGTEAVPGALSSRGTFSISWRQTVAPSGPRFDT